MAVAYRSSAAATNLSQNSLTINKPTGTVDGDVMVMIIGTTGAHSITTPTGWTLVNTYNNGATTSHQKIAIFKKVAASEGSNYTITFTVGASNQNQPAGGIASYSGADFAFDAQSGQAVASPGNKNLIAPTLTTTVANTLLLFGSYHMAAGTPRTVTPASGYTEIQDVNDASSATLEMSTNSQAGAGATGTVTAVSGNTSNPLGFGAVLIALRDAPTAVLPSAIASAEALGAPTLTSVAYALPSALAGGEAFGTAVLTAGAVVVTPTGIATAEALGSALLTAYLVPSGIATGEALGSATLVAGTVTLLPSGIATSEALGAPSLTPGAVVIFPSSAGPDEAFGSPTLTAGAVVITLSGIASDEAFGTPTLVAYLLAAGIATSEALGAPSLTPGAVTLLPAGIASDEAIGDPLVVAVGLTIAPFGLVSEEAFGSPTLTPGAVVIFPSSAGPDEAFGTPTLVAYLAPAGLASDETFGAPTLVAGVVVITLSGIATAEALGAPSLTPGAVTLHLDSIPPAEEFGTPYFVVTFATMSIHSAEAFGSTRLTAHVVLLDGIATEEAFGDLVMGVLIAPTGIATAEAFGVPILTFGEALDLLGPFIFVVPDDGRRDVELLDDGRRAVALAGMAGEFYARKLYMKQGDTLPALEAVLRDGAGNAVDLTGGGQVRWKMRAVGSTTVKVNELVTILDNGVDPDLKGRVRYEWAPSDTDEAGEFEGEFELFTAGDFATFPNPNYQAITITDDI